MEDDDDDEDEPDRGATSVLSLFPILPSVREGIERSPEGTLPTAGGDGVVVVEE